MIPIEVIIIIFFTAILQSVFGVGVLLVGTPLLMLFGYSYEDILNFTIPTSLTISMFQSIKYYNKINKVFIKSVIFFTIPLIPIGMFLASSLGSILGIIAGFFLLLVTFNVVINYILPKKTSKLRLSIILLFLGFIHGTTNLGGGLLPAIVNVKSKLKEEKLANTAFVYILFQLTQIIFLFFSNYFFDFKSGIFLIIVGLFAFFYVGKFLFLKISVSSYSKFLNYFLRLIALTLIFVKSYEIIVF